MVKIQVHKMRTSLPSLVFLLQFISLLLPSSAYTLPDKYFINCGSDANITVTSRNFIGDSNPGNSGSVTFTRQSSVVKDSNNSTSVSPLYQTARLFGQKSSYEFDITTTGTYMLRLHFFAFSSSFNLSTALFNVLVPESLLLSNFTAQNNSRSPLIKEFLLSISPGKFGISFIPKESSVAFVNAIEIFLAPDNFIPGDAKHASVTGSQGNYKGISSKTLSIVHRINVGGSNITPDNDTLGRYWVPDDSYLYNPKAAKNERYDTAPNYLEEVVSRYIAPDEVYGTAKRMNIDTNSSVRSANFNITWSFNVRKKAGHFVRIHFCDIISTSLSDFAFNLYIYRNYGSEVIPYDHTNQLAQPFYFDFVVDSDDSGFMNISIGPNRGVTDAEKDAFLNGVEIMEILAEPGYSEGTNKAKIPVIIGSVVGGVAAVVILVLVLFLILRCRKSRTVEILDCSPLAVHRGGWSQSRIPEGIALGSPAANLNLGLKISFAEIQFATKNFDAKMRIGKGGFGYVFRGTLKNGMKVAVKRREPGSGQGLPEFQTEIMVLSKIRHRHLVSLIGYCDERSEMILVYEFMEKGTLKDHLFNSGLPSLSWMQRLDICIGSARGLQYLHRGSAAGFIHRDVKSTNILLDDKLVAKVADFGLSRLGSPDQTYVSTNVKGTFGYLDPEYFRTQQLTDKSDVYSFGVVLLEVLCARPAINNALPREEVNLAEWGMICKNGGTIEQIVDPLIKGQINPNSLRKFVETAEKCLQEYGTDRPTMADVLWDLEYALQLQQTATRRLPHEDSTADVSAALALPNDQCFPSQSLALDSHTLQLDTEDMPILKDDSSSAWTNEVFSQLIMDGAR